MSSTRASLRAERVANAVNRGHAGVCIYSPSTTRIQPIKYIVAVLKTLLLWVLIYLRRCPAVFAVKN